ncbi:MAG: phenylacetate-CoA oxygenase subunit PaaJ [Gammaproteobacteria bacterium]|nr:phenylacetate-CoA oxygenase subunit PaaJ [Gammaproteobacteria bacterium]
MTPIDTPASAAQAEGRIDTAAIRRLLAEVNDPEIPVLTIEDLGVLRDVRWEGEQLIVEITPTYSACPAMQAIEQDIYRVLRREGLRSVSLRTTLAPAWTSDWISEEGRRKLLEYGIVPPHRCGTQADPAVACPRCGSGATEIISGFGSTPCKALYRCRDCLEPFDYFKCF